VRFKQPELRKARIEIVPMIDTIFFLLVFFMITWVSLVKISGLDLAVPRGNTSTQQIQGAPTLSLSPQGRYYLNGNPTTENTWQDQLRSQLMATPQTVVVLTVAPNQSTQTLISLLDTVKMVVTEAHSSAKIVIATKRVAD
jgi:biopolymer transport protein ExbD